MPTLLKTRSLSTYANKLSIPEGSLIQANNIVIDKEDIAEPRRGFKDYGTAFPATDDRTKQLLQYKDRIFRHFDNTIQFDSDNAGTFSSFSGTYVELITGLRIKYLEANSNFYFTTNSGIKKISATSNNEFSTAGGYITDAGGPKGLDLQYNLKFSTTGFLSPQSKVAYRVVWGINDNNENLILGSPSGRLVVSNTQSGVTILEETTITTVADVADSLNETYFLITDGNGTDYFVWFDTGSGSTPVTSETVGKTELEVTIATGDSDTDVAAKLANALGNLATFDVSISNTIVTVTNVGGSSTTDAFDSSGTPTGFTILTTIQGGVTSGQYADINITTTIPAEVTTTDYFYQLYRTAYTTTSTGTDLDDIDPGDEMYLVFELGVTAADIATGEITVSDVLSDSLRENGALLYTNPNSGEGITQANDRPPLAHDIALFKNITFYANTKTVHRKKLTLLGISNFVSGTAKIAIGNDIAARTYTFVGDVEVSTITADTYNNTVTDGYILLNSASDENQYFIWLNKGAFHEGSSDLSSGHNWGASPDSFDIAIGDGSAVTVSLNSTTANLAAVIIEINTELATAGVVKVEAYDAGSNHVGIRSKDNTSSFTLSNGAGTALTTLGWTAATYSPAIEPSAADTVNKIPVEVSIATDTADTEIAESIRTEINDLVDFTATRNNATITITNIKNGNTTDLSFGLTSPDPGGTNWAVAVTNQGDGEDSASNHVLLSSLASPAQAIEETTLSLVNIINRDSSGIVYAYYLSGPDDLPGQINIESRNLTDDEFYIGSEDSSINAQFDPELDSSPNVITGITAASAAQITSTAHGLSTGDSVYIYNTDSTPAIIGNYIVTKIDNNKFTVPFTTTVNGSNGNWFLTTVASDNEVSENRVYYSKISQPEAVPIVNFFDVDTKDNEIKRIIALRDNLFVLKSDGVYIVTGGIDGFTVRLLDNTAKIIAPDSAAVLNNLIYMLTTQGVVTVSDTGVSIISRQIEDLIKNVTNSRFNFEYTTFGVAYENDRSYHLWLPTETSDTVATQCYRYNIFTNSWVRWVKTNTCGLINVADGKMYLGAADREYIEQERKNNDRTDYADRDFSLTILTGKVNETTVELSSTTNVEVGDVIAQSPYVTIAKVNRLLKKLDIDVGLTDTDYYSVLNVSAGDSLATALTALTVKLTADDSGETYTTSGSDDFSVMLSDYNTIIGKLNSLASDSFYVNYRTISATSTVEGIVLSKNNTLNTVVIHASLPFIAGAVTSYQSYSSEITWAPQHFGDPESLKQISEGTLLFDGNTFYSAILSYYSDLSRAFFDIPFYGQGTGTWGGFNFGRTAWGGNGTDVPTRTFIPRNKQKCRYLTCKFTHKIAREKFKILGISMKVRRISTKAYR